MENIKKTENTYKYNSKIKLGKAVLNVSNLDKMTEYYTESIGLSVISKKEDHVELGISSESGTLIQLNRTEEPYVERYGLYHVAILLPGCSHLGNIFRHFILNRIPLIGASNHGYSEAIYLEDPEGNGIEVYSDLPVEKWDIRENGNIIGITEAMDAQGVWDSADSDSGTPASYKMPEGTEIGHIHLTVKHALKSSEFYRKIFNLGDKMTIPSGSWIASGNYHHHLAVNNWKGAYLEPGREKSPGLEYFTVIVRSEEEYRNILENIKDNNIHMEIINESDIYIKDLDNIKIKIINERY